jgi:hemerythrin-like domain-containing protein
MQTIETNQTGTRYDMYLAIHKGLRAFMADVLTTIGRIDPSDATDVADGIMQVRTLLELCRGHLFAENQFLHAAMEARRRGSACITANEHVQQEEIMEQIEGNVRAIERSSSAGRQVNLLELYRALALFVADNFQHMEVEERDNNETLWSLYTDDELHGIHQELLESIEPRKMPVYLRWILPYVTHGERVAILKEMQAAMPEPVFKQLLSVIRPHFGDKDRRKLNDYFSHLN